MPFKEKNIKKTDRSLTETAKGQVEQIKYCYDLMVKEND